MADLQSAALAQHLPLHLDLGNGVPASLLPQTRLCARPCTDCGGSEGHTEHTWAPPLRDFWYLLILYPVALLAPILSPAPHSFGDSSSRQNTCNSVCRPQWAWRVSETVWGMAWEPAVDLSSALPSRQGLWAEGHLPLQRLFRCPFLPPRPGQLSPLHHQGRGGAACSLRACAPQLGWVPRGWGHIPACLCHCHYLSTKAARLICLSECAAPGLAA